MRLILALTALALLSACGSGGGQTGSSPQAASASKDLFSSWTRTDGFKLLLSAGHFGAGQQFTMIYPSSAVCSCQASLTGSQSSGAYTLNSCSYVSGGSGDPGCASINLNGTYVKNGAVLTMCDNGCGVYQ